LAIEASAVWNVAPSIRSRTAARYRQAYSGRASAIAEVLDGPVKI